jgi:hypothetical protein
MVHESLGALRIKGHTVGVPVPMTNPDSAMIGRFSVPCA